ncbi:MAG: hypothetical protein M1838_000368 [Thelocarpon superellum]|nr:MAG: hypothetical protein M1838_000368 [Thelocarpon superellum]
MASLGPDEAGDACEAQAKVQARRCFMDLPMEIQRNIIEHASTSDLIVLALTSRHLHALACAQLYRTFSIVFPDEDDPAFEVPIDGLAGGLDTMVTSPHDHAQYLKEISLDSLSGGERGERAYRSYSYGESCGKFMNTLLVLVMRKAVALETFHWNIRVELSRELFKALHQIPTLRRLHLRLQAGPSLYMAPPPLPFASSVQPPSPHSKPLSILTSLTEPATGPAPPPYSSVAAGAGPASKHGDAARAVAPLKPEPPTFSGFKGLSGLAVLDMDTLDYVPEIAACVRQSSTTLLRLKLSLSESLASKARKVVPEDSDDSDQEMDEFGNAGPQPTLTLPPGMSAEGPTEKEAKIRAARLQQEAVLGKIFGVEKAASEVKKEAETTEMPPPPPIHQDSVNAVRDASRHLLDALTSAMENFSTNAQHASQGAAWDEEWLKVFETSAEKFIKANKDIQRTERLKQEAQAPPTEPSSHGLEVEVEAGPSSTGALEVNKSPDGASSTAVADADAKGKGKAVDGDAAQREASEDVTTPSAVAPTPIAATAGSATGRHGVEEIDLEHPDVLDGDEADAEDQEANAEACGDGSIPVAATTGGENGATSVGHAHHSGGAKAEPATNSWTKVDGEPPAARAKSGNTTGKTATSVGGGKSGAEEMQEAIHDYIRSTRKIPLQSLSLYLIPMKASVLSRCVDLSHLRRITLLNVGPQVPFWTLLANTHRFQPLNLRCINTDNVTPKFLALVNVLARVEELFLLERSSKCKVESVAGKTSVVMEQIRQQALKPHLKTLKRLMIKNENDYTWDVDVKTMKLLTKRGQALEELAISMGLRSFHLLLQFLSGLISLRALHIINFRTDDTCTWVMRELRKFAIDNVAHHPQLKLEYIGLDATVERLLRRPRASKKRKGKPVGVQNDVLVHDAGAATDSDSSSSSEIDCSEEETLISTDFNFTTYGLQHVHHGGEKQPLLKIETLENVKFYDVYSVRIFRKDVMAGRL